MTHPQREPLGSGVVELKSSVEFCTRGVRERKRKEKDGLSIEAYLLLFIFITFSFFQFVPFFVSLVFSKNIF